MKIPSDLAHLYPETKTNQCPHWRTLCPECETRFPGVETSCPDCGTSRERCGNYCMENETACRKHIRGRSYNIYTLAAQAMADGELEAMIEQDDRDLSKEYQASRYLLAAQAKDLLEDLEDGAVNHKLLGSYLKNNKAFFEIAEKRKKIEEGEQLNISIDSESKRYIQQRIKALLGAVKESLEAHIPEESKRMAVLATLREKTRLPGNAKTIVPMHKKKKASDLAKNPDLN